MTIIVNPTNHADPEMRLVQPNAFLTYPRSDGTRIFFYLWVEKYDQGHTLSGSMAQSLKFNHFYGRGYAPGTIAIQGRLRTQKQNAALAEYVRSHHMRMIDARGTANLGSLQQMPLMQFGIPLEDFYADGWIDKFQGNEKRFNPAPPFNLNFVVVRDRHSTNDNAVPSSALRRWWTGDMIDAPIQDTLTPEDPATLFHHRDSSVLDNHRHQGE